MDRSFLSQADVVTASRKFVCVRLTTYESKEEAALLKALGATRSGEVENTLFVLLAPDGKKQLTAAAREPKKLFGSPRAMADAMNRLAKDYPGKAAVPVLPKIDNVRLAVNVAACDNQPLVIVLGQDPSARAQLEAMLAELAWSEKFIGRFVYVAASSARELEAVNGVAADSAILVVQSDRFGLHGTVLKQVPAAAPPNQVAVLLEVALDKYERAAATFREHVQAGHQLGVFWETRIPVTDPMELKARAKGKK
jgi:hypothetical protein